MTQSYHSVDVDGVTIFYREAGDRSKPTILLLHGFPTASHMFRDLIPLLEGEFHLVAPDMPGFGQSDMPSRGRFAYTFDQLATTMGRFAEIIGLQSFSLYIFDYGAPVGFRMATRTPERITAIISQNGNAYHEGLSGAFAPLRAFWEDPGNDEKREALRSLLSASTTRFQYFHGVTDPTHVSPDGYSLDLAYLARPGVDDVQIDLFLDYASNVAAYPAFQKYLRDHRPPLLAVWGRNDPFFLPDGARAYRRDAPDAEVHLLETGHFALETHAGEIAELIRSFLTRQL